MSEYLLSIEERSAEIVAGACESLRVLRSAIGWSAEYIGGLVGMWGNSIRRIETGGQGFGSSPMRSPSSESIVRQLVAYGRAMQAAAEALHLSRADVARITNQTEEVVQLVWDGECLSRGVLIDMARVMGQRIRLGRMRENAGAMT